MKGCPRHFETKQDIINGLSEFPHETEALVRSLIAGRFMFVQTNKLSDDDAGITDDTHKVVMSSERDESTGKMIETRWQCERREDPNARLFRLGFTLEEAQQLIA